MSKKRRTKKEKMRAVERQNFGSALTVVPIEKIVAEVSSEVATENTPEKSTYNPYTHVIPDIRNTLVITSALVALNILVYFILKLKIVNLFGIVF